MYCSNCGKDVRETDLFCTVCGTRLMHIEENEVKDSDKDLEGNTVVKQGTIKINKNRLNIFLKIGVIGCVCMGIIVRIFSMWYLHRSDWIIHPSYYLSLIPGFIFPAFLLVLMIASDKLARRWKVGTVCIMIFIREIYVVSNVVLRVLGQVKSHMMDLADDSYRVYGYEEFYWNSFVTVIIDLGIILGFVLLLLLKKERKVILGVVIAVLGSITIFDLCNCFSREMVKYFHFNRIMFYEALMSNLLEMAICLFGIWLYTKKYSSEERTGVQI